MLTNPLTTRLSTDRVSEESTRTSAASAERLVILGVAASDAHAVANYFIALRLRLAGFTVVNLGSCTPISQFVTAFSEHPDAEALIIGSLNGHAYEDLQDLKTERSRGTLGCCPVILGGNLSVGSRKDTADDGRFHRIGVDYILDDPDALVPLLDRLHRAASAAAG